MKKRKKQQPVCEERDDVQLPHGHECRDGAMVIKNVYLMFSYSI